MKHRLSIPLLIAGLFAGVSSAQGQCNYGSVPTGIDYAVPTGNCRAANLPSDPGNFYDVNAVANDYSTLYFDAKNPSCAAAARVRFEDKLRSNVNYANSGGKICDPRRDIAGNPPTTNPFQPGLAGAAITPIFATAVALLDAGQTVDDTLLQGARNHHQGIPSPQDPQCGVASLPNVNSCMDDYVITASGFGWIAAYEYKRGRSAGVTTWAGAAQTEINKALSPWTSYGSVCYYRKGSNPARCDATKADVDANLANVIGADHLQENPGYGFALMTSVATACEGMKRANVTCTFDSNQVWIARQLLVHAQQRTTWDTTAHAYKFNNDCLYFPDVSQRRACSDPTFGGGGYLPTLFPLKRFYDAKGLTPAPVSAVVHNGWGFIPAYPFHEYNEPRFTWDRGNFWGPLRKLFYQELAYLAWPAHSQQAVTYWVQPSDVAGFGPPGTLTVAGGSTQSGPSFPVELWWRNVTTNSAWSLVSYQATPDPNGHPKDVWYNSVPATVDPYQVYDIAVRHNSGPYFYCTYRGNHAISWCTTSTATPPWP
jgi:hypothetical protein